jgi:hypothetical protein
LRIRRFFKIVAGDRFSYNGRVPPRFAFWTILIDQRPTAFRATIQDDLLPTLHQLRRTNKDVVLRWFARGKLWESPDAERAARRQPKTLEKRGPDWRPGGVHKDPRARFEKPARRERAAVGARAFKAGRPTAPPSAKTNEPRRAFQPARPTSSFKPGHKPEHGGGRFKATAQSDASRRKPFRPEFRRPRRDRRK